MEDLPYYVKKVREQQYNVDFGVVKQYFPINLVLSGILKICQDLFGNFDCYLIYSQTSETLRSQIVNNHFCSFDAGLRFEEIADAEAWHSDVQLFSVFALNSGELLGHFYLDIYSRFALTFSVIGSFLKNHMSSSSF